MFEGMLTTIHSNDLLFSGTTAIDFSSIRASIYPGTAFLFSGYSEVREDSFLGVVGEY